jgi:uncharacterized membrane protein
MWIILNRIKMRNPLRLSGKHDLWVILTLSALLTVCTVFIPSDIPRLIIGLPFVLFFPGYTVTAALFPRKDSLGGVERAALSFGLSIAVVPLIGLLLNYLWEISLYPILISVAGFVVTMCAITHLRRRQLAPEQRFEPHLHLPVLSWTGQSGLDRALTVLLAVAAIAAVGSFVYYVFAPKTGEEFTEFYVLGPSGTADYYPRELTVGGKADVLVGIVNHEGEDARYEVRISIDGTEVQAIEGIALHDGEKWEETATLTPTKAGDNQKVEFLLHRAGGPEPYQELRLWIDVRSS